MRKRRTIRAALVHRPQGQPRVSPEDDVRRRQRKRKPLELDPLVRAIRASGPALDKVARLSKGLGSYGHIAALVQVHRGCTTTELIAEALGIPGDELSPIVSDMVAAGVLNDDHAGLSLSAKVSVEEQPDDVAVKLDPGEGCSITLTVPRHLLEV